MSERTIASIADEARASGISVAELCRLAQYNQANFSRAERGEQKANPATIRRLEIGLKRAKVGKKAEVTGINERNVFALCVYAVAKFVGVSPEFVLASDPAKRATCDADWLAAAKIRRIALYVASVSTGMSRADVARAAGMTRAAVCIALKAIEDDRDDPQLDDFLNGIERVFS